MVALAAWLLLLVLLGACAGSGGLGDRIREAMLDATLHPEEKAVALYEAGKYAQAEPYAKEALERAEDPYFTEGSTLDFLAGFLSLASPGLGTSLNNLAMLYERQGRYAEAEPLLQRALAIQREGARPRPPRRRRTASTTWPSSTRPGPLRRGRAALPARPGDPREGARPRAPRRRPLASTTWPMLYETPGPLRRGRAALPARAWRSARRRSARSTPTSPPASTTWPSSTATQGRYAEAEPLYQRALAIREKALGPDHPDVATASTTWPCSTATQGRYAEAEPLYQRALAIAREGARPRPPRRRHQRSTTWPRSTQTQGRYAEAEPLFKRALAIREKALGPTTRTWPRALNNLAEADAAQGDLDEAMAAIRRIQRARSTTGAQSHADTHGMGGRRSRFTTLHRNRLPARRA